MAGSEYIITAFNTKQVIKESVNIGEVKTYKVDFSPWAEQNNNISNIDWEIKSGQVTISNKSLLNNISTALIAFTKQGRILIKLTADTETQKYVLWLDILVRDLSANLLNDYGF